MAEQNPQHVKTVGAATHRTGTLRAGVKPHKRTTTPDVGSLISTFMSAVKSGSLSQTFWGATIDKNAALLRKNFGLEASDVPYLLLDASGGAGKAGMLLAKSGLHLSNGRGSAASVAWADLPAQKIAYQRGMLTIGQSGIVSADGKVLVTLLQQLQEKFAK